MKMGIKNDGKTYCQCDCGGFAWCFRIDISDETITMVCSSCGAEELCEGFEIELQDEGDSGDAS